MLMSFRARIGQINRLVSGCVDEAWEWSSESGRTRSGGGVLLSERCTLRTALQASDLPDSAAALVGPPKSMVLEHRKHRPRGVGEAPKAALGQPHHLVEHPVEGAGERVLRGG
jgi:hypothetical protein